MVREARDQPLKQSTEKCRFMDKRVREISRFLLRRDASSTPPSVVSHELFYPEISPPQYIGGPATFMNEE